VTRKNAKLIDPVKFTRVPDEFLFSQTTLKLNVLEDDVE
jgi:hypothetical protein